MKFSFHISAKLSTKPLTATDAHDNKDKQYEEFHVSVVNDSWLYEKCMYRRLVCAVVRLRFHWNGKAANAAELPRYVDCEWFRLTLDMMIVVELNNNGNRRRVHFVNSMIDEKVTFHIF